MFENHNQDFEFDTPQAMPQETDQDTQNVIDDMVNEFAPSSTEDVQIVEPIATGTADALTAAPIFKADSLFEEEAEADDTTSIDEALAAADAALADEELPAPPKRPWIIRFLGAIVPHIGDNAFDVVRKCIMIIGILVFVGAATYLVDDLILIPIQNTVLADSLQEQYSPSNPPQLSEEEQNYPYPAGIDEAFKKLYYLNNDVRGWIKYQSTDGGETVNADYPIMQGEDNDFYLYHDFNKTYNKNGTLFYDYRNKLDNATDRNKHGIIYGHNMASGQMFAGLNKLLGGVEYARLAPTFTINTLFEKADYKVFAVMVVNNDPADGVPFSYLRTEFADDADFAGFVTEIAARSLYVYGDVDLQPTDEIVSLSTCTSYSDVHFNDGRTVVVARRVRENEAPTTDVSKVVDNIDVLMPYAWYTNQRLEPHPYYVDPNYNVPAIDTLSVITTTAPQGQSTTTLLPPGFDPTSIVIDPALTTTTTLPELTTTTMPSIPTLETTTTPAATAPYLQSFFVQSTPVNYYVGSAFNYGQTQIIGTYSNGQQFAINPYHCAVTGFDSSRVGTCFVTLHYGNLSASFYVNIIEAPTSQAPVRPTAAPTKAPTTKAPTKAPTTKAPTTTVRTTTTIKTTTTVATTTTVKTTVKPTTTTTTQAPTTTTAVAYIPPVDLDGTDPVPGEQIDE